MIDVMNTIKERINYTLSMRHGWRGWRVVGMSVTGELTGENPGNLSISVRINTRDHNSGPHMHFPRTPERRAFWDLADCDRDIVDLIAVELQQTLDAWEKRDAEKVWADAEREQVGGAQ